MNGQSIAMLIILIAGIIGMIAIGAGVRKNRLTREMSDPETKKQIFATKEYINKIKEQNIVCKEKEISGYRTSLYVTRELKLIKESSKRLDFVMSVYDENQRKLDK